MKTLNDLRNYYNTALLPDLTVFEAKRKRINTFRKVVKSTFWGGIVGAVLFVFWTELFWDQPPEWVYPFMRAFIVLGILFLIGGVPILVLIWRRVLCSIARAYYVKEFKDRIIPKIVKFVDERLKYDQAKHIPRSLFMASQIFRKEYPVYRGDDYFSGKIGKTAVEFSELYVENFRGLFFVADFNKPFTGVTLVHPAIKVKFLGRLGSAMQTAFEQMQGYQLIHLEDPEFEQRFVIYGDDQVQARYILSPGLMKRIVEFEQKSQRPIHLSFMESKIFVAISYNKPLFEPRLTETLLDFEPIREYVDDLQLALGIVEDLNLNTRIWGAPPASPVEAGILKIIEKYRALINDLRIFFYPFLRKEKFDNAIKSYASSCPEAEIPLVLIDDSATGNGKEGCLITDQSIYSKRVFEKAEYFSLSKLANIRFRAYVITKIIFANEKKILEFTNPQRKSLRLIAKMLQEMVSYSNEGKGL